jgi:hypothetical protein
MKLLLAAAIVDASHGAASQFWRSAVFRPETDGVMM